MATLMYPLTHSIVSDILPGAKKPLYMLEEEIPKFKFKMDINMRERADNVRNQIDHLPKRTFREAAFVIDDPTLRDSYLRSQHKIKLSSADFNGFETQLFGVINNDLQPIAKAKDQSNDDYYQELRILNSEQDFYDRSNDKFKIFQVPYVVKSAVLKYTASFDVTDTEPFSCTDFESIDFFEPKEFILLILSTLPAICEYHKKIKSIPDYRRDSVIRDDMQKIDAQISQALSARKEVGMDLLFRRDHIEIYSLLNRMKYSRFANEMLVRRLAMERLIEDCEKTLAFGAAISNPAMRLKDFAENAFIGDMNSSSVSHLFLGLDCLKQLIGFHLYLTFHYKRNFQKNLTYEDLDQMKIRRRLFDIAFQPQPLMKVPDSKTSIPKRWKLVAPAPLTSIDLISIMRLFDTEYIKFLYNDLDESAEPDSDRPIWKMPDGTIKECDSVNHILRQIPRNVRHLNLMKKMQIRVGIAVQDSLSKAMVMKNLCRPVAHPQIQFADAYQLSPQYLTKRLFTLLQMMRTSDIQESDSNTDESLLKENMIKFNFIASPKMIRDLNLSEIIRQKAATSSSQEMTKNAQSYLLDGMNDIMDIYNQKLFFYAMHTTQTSLLDYHMDISRSFIRNHNEITKRNNEKARLLRQKVIRSDQRLSIPLTRDASARHAANKAKSEILSDIFYKVREPDSRFTSRFNTDSQTSMTSFLAKMPKHHVFFIPLPDIHLESFDDLHQDDFNLMTEEYSCMQNTLLSSNKDIATVIVDVTANKLLIFTPNPSRTSRLIELVLILLISMGFKFRKSQFVDHLVYDNRPLTFNSSHFHRPQDISTININKSKRLFQLAQAAKSIKSDYEKNNILVYNRQPAIRAIDIVPSDSMPDVDEIDRLTDDDRINMGFQQYIKPPRRQRQGQRPAADQQQQQGGNLHFHAGMKLKNVSKRSYRGGAEPDGFIIPPPALREKQNDREESRRNDIMKEMKSLLQVNTDTMMPLFNVWFAINYILEKQNSRSTVPFPKNLSKSKDMYTEDDSKLYFETSPLKVDNALTPDGFINQMYKSSEFQGDETSAFKKNVNNLLQAVFDDFFQAPRRPQEDLRQSRQDNQRDNRQDNRPQENAQNDIFRVSTN